MLLVENWSGFPIIYIDVVWRYVGQEYAELSPEFTKISNHVFQTNESHLYAPSTRHTALTCWGGSQPFCRYFWLTDRHAGKKTQSRCHPYNNIILSVFIFFTDFIRGCHLQPRTSLASDQPAQNHVFAGRFWVLRHYVLVFISAEYAIWTSDHFISKLGDFYHINVALFAW